ncbi:pyruvate formate lyase family protein [Buttiauxella sp. A111]|uniref:pyruvate formate lyase family protein n=1 Tax=Buttiauxella sp. A111 TaxID=2563088 RepID=UPI0010ECA011|nr:pyruvate formate lyase family protein [Buttiauxella sp. A111]GDX04824.1 pyruvate formate-lyase [Buttiauxella sp. A111]
MSAPVIAEQVDVNKKIPCEKTPVEQLAVMEAYTLAHRSESSPLIREVKCLQALYPTLFRSIQPEDKIIGRLDVLPIGFGCVTSVGGVGHYCNFSKLAEFKSSLPEGLHHRIDALLDYWHTHDTRSIYFRQTLKDDTLGKFVDVNYPAIATARLSGMYLDYNLLIDLGLTGLREKIQHKLDAAIAREDEQTITLHQAFLGMLSIVVTVIDRHIQLAANELETTPDLARKQHLSTLIDALMHIRTQKPETFLQGIQLSWLYSLCAGVVNYGRMDDYLGALLVHDLNAGLLTEREAIDYIRSHYRLIEARKTTVNGRVIVGGRGRRQPEHADVYCRLAIQAVQENQDTEPQFTLRIYQGMNPAIYQQALDVIGTGITYPILYNDDVNIPAVMHSMQVSEEDAEQYVPFGCGEFVLSGRSVGTPNTCMNVLKILNIALTGGIDFWDGKNKSGGVVLKTPQQISSFDDVMSNYKNLLNYYIAITAKAQASSYRVMNQQVGFLLTSLLTSDCIEREKTLLNGGAYRLGGTNETYGNTNASDSLAAIKKVIFEQQKYDYATLIEALKVDFVDHEKMRNDLINAPKFGNDDGYADEIAVEMHEYICNGVRDAAQQVGLDSYLVVIINNQVNTEWGRATSASADGRQCGVYMSNANNPQSGADKNGPTAMLNSLVKLDAKYHAGSVQNIKFSKTLFNTRRPLVNALMEGYFEQGGPQLMVSVVGKGELEAAYQHPENYPNLIVRVGGFSARFVNLDRDVQLEILNRTLND